MISHSTIRDLLLILIGTFVAAGFQAFNVLTSIIAYPQLFPSSLNLFNYGMTQGLLFVFSFGLAWWIISSKLPSYSATQPSYSDSEKKDGHPSKR